MISKTILTILLTIVVISAVSSQTCPTADFTASSTVCIDEQVEINNSSSNNPISFSWDFCSGDFEVNPSTNTVISNSLLNRSFAISIERDDAEWIGYAPSSSGNRLNRIDFQGSLSNSSIEVENTVLSGGLSNPNAIDLVEIAGSWFGIVGNSSNQDILVLSFGDSLASDPEVDIYSNLLPFSTVTDIEIFLFGNNIYAYVVNESNTDLALLDFGTSLGGPTPPMVSTQSIPGALNYSDLALIQDCNKYYGLITSFNSREVYYLALNEDPTSIDSIAELTFPGVTFGRPRSSVLVAEGGSFYGLVLEQISGDVVRIDFGTTMDSSPTGTTTSSGTFVGVSGLTVVNDSSDYHGFAIGVNSNTFYRLDYMNPCGASPAISQGQSPSLAYGSDGTFQISMEARDANSNSSYVSRTVTVSTDVAPSISFVQGNNVCISSSISFTSSSNQTNLTYAWDLDGNGMADSTSANPTITYPATGQYVPRLDVTNTDGCTNFTTSSITIYNEPTTPAYTLSKSQFCVGEAFKATNTTDTVGFDNNITFTWTIAETGQQFTGYNPDFSVAATGTYTLQCQTTIPGCESSVINTALSVIPSPTTDFSFTPTCLGETTTFTNLTTGVISYLWDFGDGFTSNLENPQHLYDTAGAYTVSFSATNSTGCSTLSSQSITVKSVPTAGFQAVLPCEGEVSINDTSSVLNSSITSWQWFLDGEQVSTSQNPQLTIPESGDYQITEIVTSALNCTSQASQTLTVLDAANPNFSVLNACNGSPFSFADVSTTASNNLIISRSWNVNGTSYTDSSFQHTFPNPGTFPVSLTVVTQNLCAVTFSDSITVADEPVLNFSIPAACQNEFLNIQDMSTTTNDSIVSRQWFIDDQLSGNGAVLVFQFTNDTIFNVQLQVTTALGCTYSLTKSIEVRPSGEAAFEASSTFGVQGSSISFENTSNMGASYQWFVDGDSASSDLNYVHTFNTSGNHEVQLITFTESSCRDTILSNILIQIPVVDLLLTEVLLNDQNDGFSSIVASVENQSNLPVENLRFTIQIDDQLPTRDRIQQIIGVGESRVVQLDADVPNSASYICINVSTTYEAEDLNSIDNEYCIAREPEIIFEPPFPNPAVDEVSVRTILPADGEVTVSLVNMSGKIEVSETFSDLTQGLQSFSISIATYDPGMYLLRMSYQDVVEVIRFLKQ